MTEIKFNYERWLKHYNKPCPCKLDKGEHNICPCVEFRETKKCICKLFLIE